MVIASNKTKDLPSVTDAARSVLHVHHVKQWDSTVCP
jgi:hypothetical protein